jgi:hypothetical protein
MMAFSTVAHTIAAPKLMTLGILELNIITITIETKIMTLKI